MTDTASTRPADAVEDGSSAAWPSRDREPRRLGRSEPPASVARAVALFAAAGAVVLLLLAGAGALVLRSVAQDEAIREAERVTRLAAEGIVAPQVTAGVIDGDRGALARLDRIVSDRLLRLTPVSRVKLWTADGRIVYADEPRLLGSRYPLGGEDLEVLRSGEMEAELSDLSEPENRFERGRGRLLEVYTRIRATDGRPLLFEAYLPATSIAASERRYLTAFAPTALGALLLLAVLQLPLAASLAKRLRDRQSEREALLSHAIDASDSERRRIAQDLHDGVVQDLVGLSYKLSAAAGGVSGDDSGHAREALLDGAKEARRSVRQLRSLLVSVYPPDLHRMGLAAVLTDLVSDLPARGIEPRVSVAGERLSADTEALFFRVTQEALRNALEHADPKSITIRVSCDAEAAHLLVEDDGRGFDPAQAGREGHFGLRLLDDLARAAQGRFALDSTPGRGTCVHLEVPIS